MFLNLFSSWIALLPLVIWNMGYEGPKVVYFFSGCTFLVSYWIVKLLKNPKVLWFSQTDIWYLLWLVALTVASLFGVHPFESIVGGSYRHQGVIFFLGLWLVGKTIGLLNKDQKKSLIKKMGIVIFAESIIVISQFLFGNLYLGRPLGTIGETNAVAGFLAAGSYFVFESMPKILLLLIPAAVLLTLSRSGIFAGLLMGTGFLGSIYSIHVKFWKRVWRIFPIILLAILLFLVFFSGKREGSYFEDRSVIWKLGIMKVLQKPVIGYGAESGEVVYNKAFYQSGFPLSGLIVDRAHNLFLDVAMWSGLIGLFFFGGWLYSSFIKLGSLNKKLTVLSLLVYAMFQPLSIVHWILLIIIVNI